MIDVNGLNALHAATTQGDWQRCQAGDGQCPCGLVWDANEEIQITVCSPQPIADAMWITESHNAWPAVEARLAILEEFARRVRNSVDGNSNSTLLFHYVQFDIEWLSHQAKKAMET